MTKQAQNPTDLVRALRNDCMHEAEALQMSLQEVIERLEEGDHLAALGAFSGMDERALYIGTALKRLSRLPVRESKSTFQGGRTQ